MTPNYFSTAGQILLESQENRLVTFFARRDSDTTVQDAEGQIVQMYREGGFFTSSVFLPGNNGDCLQLVGVPTERSDSGVVSRRFRLRDATVDPLGGGLCFPPNSVVSLSGPMEVGVPLTLTATTQDLNGFTAGPPLSSYFAANDIDGAGASLPVTMTFAGIDITGQTGLTFSALVAEDDEAADDWDETDFVHIDYQIDGGGYQDLLHFENDGSQFNSPPFVDTDFDGIGDGTEVTNAFTQFLASIPGTGSTLDIRITFSLNAGDEDIAFDDIQVLNDLDTQLLLEDFEDASVEYTTSIPEFNSGGFDFFTRTDGSDLGSFIGYTAAGGGMQLLGSVTQVEFFVSTDGGQTFTSIGIDSTPGDGFTIDYTPPADGEYQFYSIATDNDSLVESAPLLADDTTTVASTIPDPAEVNVPTLPQLAKIVLALGLLLMVVYRLRRVD